MIRTQTIPHLPRRRFGTLLTIAAAIAGATVSGSASESYLPIDTSQSAITVRVSKTGLLRSFGDNHEIRASVKSGFIKITHPLQANVVVDARNLQVLDVAASPSDREQVRARMLGADVLDSNRFPEIRFESSSAERRETGVWIVHGELTLHGRTRPVVTIITEDQGHYRGAFTLRQTDYGITPVSVAGGMVGVKDELKIEFDIVTLAAATTNEE